MTISQTFWRKIYLDELLEDQLFYSDMSIDRAMDKKQPHQYMSGLRSLNMLVFCELHHPKLIH